MIFVIQIGDNRSSIWENRFRWLPRLQRKFWYHDERPSLKWLWFRVTTIYCLQ